MKYSEIRTLINAEIAKLKLIDPMELSSADYGRLEDAARGLMDLVNALPNDPENEVEMIGPAWRDREDADAEGLCAMLKDLHTLRDRSMSLWDLAFETCHDSEGRVEAASQAECDVARACAVDEWATAIQAVEDDDFEAARAALKNAASLGLEWGSDDTEREALAMLGASEGDQQ